MDRYYLLTVFILTFTAVATAALTIISSEGSLHDSRRKWFNRVTKRGWYVTAIRFFILVLSVCQYLVSESKENSKEEFAKLENAKRDSTTISKINNGVDSNSKKLFENLSEALAKHGYKFDSVTKQIDRIVENTRRIIDEIDSRSLALSKIKLQTVVDEIYNDMIGAMAIQGYHVVNIMMVEDPMNYIECRKKLNPVFSIINDNSDNFFLQSNPLVRNLWDYLRKSISAIVTYAYASPEKELRAKHHSDLAYVCDEVLPKLKEVLK